MTMYENLQNNCQIKNEKKKYFVNFLIELLRRIFDQNKKENKSNKQTNYIKLQRYEYSTNSLKNEGM